MSYNSKYKGSEVDAALDLAMTALQEKDKADLATKEDVTITEVAKVTDGVYAVTADGSLIDYNTADSSCLGVALVQGEHKFMIAKSDATDGTNTTLYWGINLYGKDVAGITETADNSVAKTDFNGKANTDAIAAAYGQHSVDMDSRDMCKVLATYAEGGFTDWYVPSCGQLYEVYTKKSDINTALQNIGGTAFKSYFYWSSSEYDSDDAWGVSFSSGGVGGSDKYGNYRVRFVRDISTEKKIPLKDYTLSLNDKIEVKQDKNLYFSDVEASDWVDSTEYSEYPYQCDLLCDGVRPEYYPEVVFGASEAASGNYAALCESLTDAVRIYSKVSTSIIIPTVQISK